MAASDLRRQALRILSLDGNGPGVICQMRIIQEIMNRRAYDLKVKVDTLYPGDEFDVIGGVDFGGVVAVLLGCLRMTAPEANEWLIKIGKSLFPKKGKCDKDMSNLKKILKEILEKRNFPPEIAMTDSRLQNPVSKCKVILLALRETDPTVPQLFCNYQGRTTPVNCTLVNAICANLSYTPWFSPVSIGPELELQNYSSAALGFNNPTEQILQETASIFGRGVSLSLILSLGTGRPLVSSYGGDSKAFPVNDLLCSTEEAEVRVADTFLSHLNQPYIRIGVNAIAGYEISNWTTPGNYVGHTQRYLRHPNIVVDINNVIEKLKPEQAAETALPTPASAGEPNDSVPPFISSPSTWPRVAPILGLLLSLFLTSLLWHLARVPATGLSNTYSLHEQIPTLSPQFVPHTENIASTEVGGDKVSAINESEKNSESSDESKDNLSPVEQDIEPEGGIFEAFSELGDVIGGAFSELGDTIGGAFVSMFGDEPDHESGNSDD